MTVFATFKLSIFINCWIFSLNQFRLVSGVRPRCKGDQLHFADFSHKDEVGFLRDVCVDTIARNMYNELGYPVSPLCNKLVENEIRNTAEALMGSLLENVSKDTSLDRINKEFMFVRIVHAKRRLIDTGAVPKDSKLVDLLQDLKKYFAIGSEFYQHQIEYQESIGKYDPSDMKKWGELLEDKDFVSAVEQFIKNFHVENEAKIYSYHLENNVVAKITTCGVMRLKFEYGKDGGDTKSGSVILKIPFLSHDFESWNEIYAYDRETYFYVVLLPTMYQMGKCEPFAPKLYVATQANVLVLENLSDEGYKRVDNFKFFDLDHSRLSLIVLAKYHALSYKYIQSFSQNDQNIQLIQSNGSERIEIQPGKLQALCEVIKWTSSSNLMLLEKVLKMVNQILTIVPTMNFIRNGMTVIIHGDFHERNILFKYDINGKVCQAKIIDWQLSRKGNPLMDLIDFLIANVNIDILETNEDDLLKSYLDTLNHYLSLTSANRVYSRLELDEDMEFFKYHFFDTLSKVAFNIKNLQPSEGQQLQSHITKWVIYLEKKGLI